MHMCRGTRCKKLRARRHSAVAFRGAYGQICLLRSFFKTGECDFLYLSDRFEVRTELSETTTSIVLIKDRKALPRQ